MISQRKTSRTRRGALTAEWAMTLYVLFFLFALPLLDYGVFGLRTFFLWFACNQAVLAGSKAHTLVNPITIGGQLFNGGLSLAFTRALQVKNAFGANNAISWTNSYPAIYIKFLPFPNSASGSTPPALPTIGPLTYVSGTTVSPVKTVPDSSLYLCEFDVVIVGTIQPFLVIPILGYAPGLTGPVTMTVQGSAQFENPPGLVE